jgi:hypothetical protein
LASDRQPLIGIPPQPWAQINPTTSLWGYFWGYKMRTVENTPNAPRIHSKKPFAHQRKRKTLVKKGYT